MLGLTPLLASCQIQWVSPYNADLQKNATAMLSEVVAWEGQMKAAAGTEATDPRNPKVVAALTKWRGEIEAMSQIELSIDPGSTSCDDFLNLINKGISDLATKLPTSPSLNTGGLGLSQPKPITHCETLPGIFTRMIKQVDKMIPLILAQQCQMSWVPDSYFAGQNGTGGVAPKAPAPSQGQMDALKAMCKPLFDAPPGAAHGNLMDSLITDLDAIIYREGREAPQASNG